MTKRTNGFVPLVALIIIAAAVIVGGGVSIYFALQPRVPVPVTGSIPLNPSVSSSVSSATDLHRDFFDELGVSFLEPYENFIYSGGSDAIGVSSKLLVNAEGESCDPKNNALGIIERVNKKDLDRGDSPWLRSDVLRQEVEEKTAVEFKDFYLRYLHPQATCSEKHNDLEVQEISKIMKMFQTAFIFDTSTWRTYRNEKYGFEIKYPSFYGEFREEGSQWVTAGSSKPATLKIEALPTTPLLLFSGIDGAQFYFDKEKKQFYIKQGWEPKITYKEKLFHDRNLYIKIMNGEGGDDWWGLYEGYMIYNEKKNILVRISTASNPNTYNDGPKLEEIFSTFKFTDSGTTDTSAGSTTLTTSWQTYHNNEYGFEFMHPENFPISKNQNAFPPSELTLLGPSGVGDFLVFVYGGPYISDLTKLRSTYEAINNTVISDISTPAEVKGIKVVTRYPDAREASGEITVRYFFYQAPYQYEFRSNISIDDTVSKIVSTFKFD